jgi:hypothetical protein
VNKFVTDSQQLKKIYMDAKIALPGIAESDGILGRSAIYVNAVRSIFNGCITNTEKLLICWLRNYRNRKPKMRF